MTFAARIAILSLALACNRTDRIDLSRELAANAPTLSHAALKPVLLTGREVAADTMLGTPSRVKVLSDSLLLVVDALPPFFHLIQRQDGRLLSSFGRKGRGPGEFNSAVDVALVRNHAMQFWAYDVERRLMTLVEIGTPPGPDARIIEIKRIGYYNAPLAADDSLVVVQSNSDSSAVAVYNTMSGDVQLTGTGMEFVAPPGMEMSPTARRQLNADIRMCAGPRGRFVRFHRLSGRLEVPDSNGTVRPVNVPYAFGPAFEMTPDHGLAVYVANPNQRSGYQECVATDQVLLALFAGRRWEALKREEKNEFRNSNFLHVFSWEGELLGTAQLSEQIVGMDIDTATGELYGVRFRPEPSLVVFDLRKLWERLGKPAA